MKTRHARAYSSEPRQLATAKFKLLRKGLTEILSTIDSILNSEVRDIDWNFAFRVATRCRDVAWQCIHVLEPLVESERRKGVVNSALSYDIYDLHQLITDLQKLATLAESNEARLSNVAAVLLVGDAGTGKTHLFCDVAKQREACDLPTLLLLGGHFDDREPWSQITQLLGLSCSRDEFLGALEAAAQTRRRRALILIDALNEGEGKSLWYKHLAGILQVLSRYPWIAVAFGVRTSYEDVIVPPGLVPDKLVRQTHYGFLGQEYQAARTFFQYYRIKQPSIPLLVPEFQNPLFLKLFCLALHNRGLTAIPTGLRGITSIFGFFVESVNSKLSAPASLDFDPKVNVVEQALAGLGKEMVRIGSMWLTRDDAHRIVDAYLPRPNFSKSLFGYCVSEGVLSEDRFRTPDGNWCDGIRFSYERFADHIVARHLIGDHLDLSNVLTAFQPHMPLGRLVSDQQSSMQNSGIIGALSIQLPELVGKEMVELAPHCADYSAVRKAFVESLIWRDPRSIKDSTLEYINGHILKHPETHEQLLNALLTIATVPNHPYNADFLHKQLIEKDLADRDAVWSIFIYYAFGGQGPVDSTLDWALSKEDKSNIGDESLRLCGIVLGWFLTSSNRFLRDRSTKAMVCLFSNRLNLLKQILRQFQHVNDPYVLERLFAVAYGCAMRSINDSAVGELANEVYEIVFREGEPPPDIMLRDYARGCIELATRRGLDLKFDMNRVRPPYRSIPPETVSKEELAKWGKSYPGMPLEEWSRVHLYSSVMGQDDFARYIIGTNWKGLRWTSQRLADKTQSSKYPPLDTSLAQTWIFKKVLELGWSVERFGRFDRIVMQEDSGSAALKSERIGKKYQWIAYHEFLARIADNFEFRPDRWHSEPSKYDGPWQLSYIRDIDPSCLLRTKPSEVQAKAWWSVAYESWNPQIQDLRWIRYLKDLPPVAGLLEVTNPQDGSRWLTLEANHEWTEPILKGQDTLETSRRHMWYQIRSYFVKKSDMNKLYEWVRKQDFMGRWMPESNQLTDVFLGEFFWAPSFRYYRNDADGWTRGDNDVIPKQVLVSTDQYLREYETYDCSIDESIDLYLPSKFLVDQLDLRWNGVDGKFFDEHSNLVVFDPSVEFPGPAALLVNRDSITKFLSESEFDIIWTILGQKVIIGQIRDADYKGALQFSGAYRMQNNRVRGALKPRYLAPRTKRRAPVRIKRHNVKKHSTRKADPRGSSH
jgi:hypothetical protein